MVNSEQEKNEKRLVITMFLVATLGIIASLILPFIM